jgi:TonB-dependent receptor-like protein
VDGTSSSSGGRQTIKSQSLVFGWTKIISPSLVNEFRLSWSHGDSDGFQDPYGQLPTGDAQIKGVAQDPLFAGGVVRTTIQGYFGGTNIGSPDFLPKFQHTNQFEFIDTLSMIKGNHQFKLGADIMTPMNNEYMDVPATRGMLGFRTRFTGNAVADFLLGYVSDASLSNPFVVNQRHYATMFFAQDDWKVNSKLALNLGVRYDYMTPAYEADNHMANFDPATASLVFAKDGSIADRALVNPDRNNVAPRVGFVYNISEKLLVRGGYGIFYNLFDRIGSEDQLALNPPGLVNNVVGSSTTAPVFFLKDGFPAGYLDPNAPGLLKRARVRAINPDSKNTLIQQFSLGFQAELGAGMVVSIDGIRTTGDNLAELRNLNQAPTGGVGVLPYPTFGFIEYRGTRATSDYKGMDVSLERRFRAGWSFALAYTLGKSTDNSGEHLNTNVSFPQNGYDLNAWEGPSDFDVRHRFVGNFVAELPFGEGKKWAQTGFGKAVLGGWTLSGIYTIRTGLPFTVIESGNVGINMQPLPNRTGSGEGPQTVDQWYDPTAFTVVPAGVFGNSGRNILRGPGWQSADMSLQRRFKIKNSAGATIRWDVFNLFNHTNFGLPDPNVSNTTRATITTLSGDPRLMQFALRLDF